MIHQHEIFLHNIILVGFYSKNQTNFKIYMKKNKIKKCIINFDINYYYYYKCKRELKNI